MFREALLFFTFSFFFLFFYLFFKYKQRHHYGDVRENRMLKATL